jgi:hypothetical protein
MLVIFILGCTSACLLNLISFVRVESCMAIYFMAICFCCITVTFHESDMINGSVRFDKAFDCMLNDYRFLCLFLMLLLFTGS